MIKHFKTYIVEDNTCPIYWRFDDEKTSFEKELNKLAKDLAENGEKIGRTVQLSKEEEYEIFGDDAEIFEE